MAGPPTTTEATSWRPTGESTTPCSGRSSRALVAEEGLEQPHPVLGGETEEADSHLVAARGNDLAAYTQRFRPIAEIEIELEDGAGDAAGGHGEADPFLRQVDRSTRDRRGSRAIVDEELAAKSRRAPPLGDVLRVQHGPPIAGSSANDKKPAPAAF